jgi:hypothetical protein
MSEVWEGTGPVDGFASSYRDSSPQASAFPNTDTWWQSSSKEKKVAERVYTRNGSGQATKVVSRLYDPDGSTVLLTVTEVIVYSGAFEKFRTRTVS